VWTGDEMIIWGGADNRIGHHDGARFNPITGRWSPMSTSTAVAACSKHSAVWSGTEMIVWGGQLGPDRSLCHQGGRYDPRTDRWTPIDDGGRMLGRTEHTAVWTGDEMIIWGGMGQPDITWIGARYHPQRGWSQLTAVDQPNPTYGHSVVWTGQRMIVWGGVSPERHFSVITGGMYDPRLDRWTPTEADGAPEPRSHHTAVWTGSAMLVWGGYGATERIPGVVWGNGASFDPVANRWSAGLSVQGAGGRRLHHTAVWATGPSLGGRMLIWGGAAAEVGDTIPGLASGGAYDPVADRWSDLPGQPPAGRCFHTAVWTGSRMLIWGGMDPAPPAPAYFADGAAYTP
jgi:hypothetical protein